MDIKQYIADLVKRYKYRSLPDAVRSEAIEIYNANLNGFDSKRPCSINNQLIASDFNRVVVGDYGAWVEISKDSLLKPLSIKDDQKWRFDEKFVTDKKLSLKYYIYNYEDCDVYHQIKTVSYADYKPDQYYINVIDFDKCAVLPDLTTPMELLESLLVSGNVFTHTEIEAAEAYIEDLKTSYVDKINVAIVGDKTITDKSTVTKLINMLLRPFKSPNNMRILTGEDDGVERIVRIWGKRNKFETDIYPIMERPDWVISDRTAKEERDLRMAYAAHVVIIISNKSSRRHSLMYKTAVECGRFVTKRIIK